MDPFAVLLEKTSRTLPLNTPIEIQGIRDLLNKVVANILANPWQIKYRTLKVGNKTLRARLFDRVGAKEIMSVLGFKRLEAFDTGEAAMVLPFDPEEETLVASEVEGTSEMPSSTSARALEEAWAWLSSQLDATLEMGHTSMTGRGAAGRGCCAGCCLQLRLPSGVTVKAGFLASEPLRAVRDFLNTTCPLSPLPLPPSAAAAAPLTAASSSGEEAETASPPAPVTFHEESHRLADQDHAGSSLEMLAETSGSRSSSSSGSGVSGGVDDGGGRRVWVLQQAFPTNVVVFSGEEQLGQSLSELGLVPRATLVATPSASLSLSSPETGSLGNGAPLDPRAHAAVQMKQARELDAAKRRANETSLRKAKALAAEEKRKERERLLGEFNSDREEARERAAASRPVTVSSDLAESAPPNPL